MRINLRNRAMQCGPAGEGRQTRRRWSVEGTSDCGEEGITVAEVLVLELVCEHLGQEVAGDAGGS